MKTSENVIKEKKILQEPQISLTMISRYIVASEKRKISILKGCKYPPEYIPRFYEIARKIACEAFALNFIGQHEIYFEDFKRHAKRLRSEATDYPEKKDNHKNRIYSAKGLEGIVAIENLLEPILQSYVLENNLSNRRNKIIINNVRIGAVADMLLLDVTTNPVGFLKFNFSSDELSKEEVALKLCVLHRYYQSKDLNFHPKSCFLVDVKAWRIYTLADLQTTSNLLDQACLEIFNNWKTA